jgi:hypothetical protein
MPLVANIRPADREAFVKGVQSTGGIWNSIFTFNMSDLSPHKIFRDACEGFLQNHPGYDTQFKEDMERVLQDIPSPVPMIVYRYWENTMQDKYGWKINSSIQDIFQEGYKQSQAPSEMRRIGDAIESAQSALQKQGYVLPQSLTGIDIAQQCTHSDLEIGIYPPVCFAWLPDDLRQDAEAVFREHDKYQASSRAMIYSFIKGRSAAICASISSAVASP